MLFSKRALVKIILPLIIQQMLALAIGTVNSMMVAPAGEAAVSGVSLVNALDALLILTFNSLVTGGSVVVSQALGTKEPGAARDAAKQLFWAVTGISVLLTVTVLTFRHPLLAGVFGEVEPDVMESAQDYFFFIALSFPFMAVSNVTDALLRSMGNSLISMLTSLITNLINVAGNAVLILGFEMGAAGAAISTLISRLIGAVILTVLLHNPKYPVCFVKLWQYRPDFRIIRSVLRIGIPGGLESAMVQAGRLIMQTLVAPMGTAAIAAKSVANTIANFQYAAGYAYQNAMIPVVGRCIGACEAKQAKRYARWMVVLNYLTLWAVSVVTFLLVRPIIAVYDLSAAAADLACQLTVFHLICAAVLWPIAFTLPVAFRAAGDVRYPLAVSMLSLWGMRVVLGYFFALDTVSVLGFTFPGLGMGVIGTWISMTIDWLFRCVLFSIRYITGRWIPKHMRETAREKPMQTIL